MYVLYGIGIRIWFAVARTTSYPAARFGQGPGIASGGGSDADIDGFKRTARPPHAPVAETGLRCLAMTTRVSTRGPLNWFLKALGGALIVAIGLLTVYIGSGYSFGTTRTMGPGYFPVVLGVALALVGLAIMLMDLLAPEHSIAQFDVRAALAILGAMLTFAALIRPLGLAATIMIVVAIASLAERDFKPVRILVLGGALVAVTTTLFVVLLRLHIKVLPW